jgi:colanic acid/amylovoran biosynthesis protein
VEVAEDQPGPAARIYPELRFHPGFHARHEGIARWRTQSGAGSMRRRRTSLAVRLLGRAPRLARTLMDRWERAHVDRIARADAVVFTGGTNLVEHYSFAKQLDEVRAAIAVGTPVFLYTQSMGPYRKPRNRALMARLLPRCARIFLRDERSRGHLRDIGVPEAIMSVHADAAFALAAGADALPAVATRRVAISVRTWSHARRADGADARDAYRRAVAAAARALAEQGAEVVFLSTCQGIPEYWTDDAVFAQGIVDEFLAGVAGVRVEGGFHAPSELIRLFGAFDMVIATRMHAAILSLVAHTPVLGIAYEFKTRELLATVGLEAYCVDFETVDGTTLGERARTLLAEAPRLRDRIAARSAPFRQDAREPARRIRAWLAARGAAVPS